MLRDLLKEYYGKDATREWKRLVGDPFHRIEFDTTMLFLKKYLPESGSILDAGGGPGRYTIELARLGYNLVLLDLMPELLQIARKQIRKEKLQDRVKEIVEGSVEDLSLYEDNTFDAVVCLGGVLCHLIDKKSRQKAANELVRTAKDGAPVFVSVIGRLAICANSIVYLWPEMLKAPDIFRKYTTTGDYLGEWGFAPAHFYSIEELKEEFERKSTTLQIIGLEGIFSTHEKQYNRVYKLGEYNDLLWETHLRTCTDPCVAGTSEHFMGIFRKNSSGRKAERM